MLLSSLGEICLGVGGLPAPADLDTTHHDLVDI